MRLAGIGNLRPDFISLKGEYWNMADNKPSLINDPLPSIQTNRTCFGTDLTEVGKYK